MNKAFLKLLFLLFLPLSVMAQNLKYEGVHTSFEYPSTFIVKDKTDTECEKYHMHDQKSEDYMYIQHTISADLVDMSKGQKYDLAMMALSESNLKQTFMPNQTFGYGVKMVNSILYFDDVKDYSTSTMVAFGRKIKYTVTMYKNSEKIDERTFIAEMRIMFKGSHMCSVNMVVTQESSLQRLRGLISTITLKK